MKYQWARYHENGYEVSSRGDRRFSAFYARLPNGLTVEMAYQKAKGTGKGRAALDPNFDYWGNYLGLWRQWVEANPDLFALLAELASNKVLTDMFAKTQNNQARALCVLLNEKYGE